jgi:RNA polymerase sigma-70 factor (ECF subfamily)
MWWTAKVLQRWNEVFQIGAKDSVSRMSEQGAKADPERRPILDRSSFAHFAASHRRELKVHCYRMMGSLHEADDLVQDTLLRAWRARAGFDGRGSLRGWLYSIATNACLNAIKARGRLRRIIVAPDRLPTSGPASAGAAAKLLWLEPYPDPELPDPQDSTPGPEARYEQREAIRFAFVAAIQELPPRQRAVLLLADVLGWSAAETASLLGTSRTVAAEFSFFMAIPVMLGASGLKVVKFFLLDGYTFTA